MGFGRKFSKENLGFWPKNFRIFSMKKVGFGGSLKKKLPKKKVVFNFSRDFWWKILAKVAYKFPGKIRFFHFDENFRLFSFTPGHL